MSTQTSTPSSPLRVCVAGVTGEVGRLLAAAILAQEDLLLSSAVARTSAGTSVGEALGNLCAVEIRPSVAEALLKDEFDVLVDYTSARAALPNLQAAVAAGVHVVLGSSGVTAEELSAIDQEARLHGVGVVTGNFAIGAVLAQIFATCAARYLGHWEIVEYALREKIDAPSGTARELAERLSRCASSEPVAPVEPVVGDSRARGARVQVTQIHSIRLPGFVAAFEIILGRGSERLSIRHETIHRGVPYVDGTLLAIRGIRTLTGVHQGLESIVNLQVT